MEKATHQIRKVILSKWGKMKSSSVHEDRVKPTFQQLRHSLHQNLGIVCLREINILCPESQFQKVFCSSAQHDPSSQGQFGLITYQRKFELCND